MSGYRIIIYFFVVFFVISGYFLSSNYFYDLIDNREKYIPEGFLYAKKDGAQVAEKIVFLSNQALSGIQLINSLDKEGKYKEAINLVNSEIKRNEEAKKEAIILSSHLNTMTSYVNEIQPNRIKNSIITAISFEVNLVNHLIIYYGLLNNLLDNLNKKFNGEKDTNNTELINQINEEIRIINELNNRFNEEIKIVN